MGGMGQALSLALSVCPKSSQKCLARFLWLNHGLSEPPFGRKRTPCYNSAHPEGGQCPRFGRTFFQEVVS